MSFFASFEVTTPLFRDVTQSFPSLEYVVEDEFLSADGTFVITAWAIGPSETLDRADETVRTDQTVDDVSVLASLEDRRLYRLELTEHAAEKVTYTDAIEHGITFLDVRLSGDTVTYRSRVPDRDALNGYRAACERRGLSFTLRRVYGAGPEDRCEYALTYRQREVLRSAFSAGYFAIPRQSDLGDLATELDVSEQALSATIRRGVANLLATTVASDLDVDGDAI